MKRVVVTGDCQGWSKEQQKSEENPQIMVDSTGNNSANVSKPNERSECPPASCHEDIEGSKMLEEKENKKEKPGDVVTNNGKQEEIAICGKDSGRNRSKSNQRWMKLRTTVQISGAISSTNQKSKPPLKREDSFLKRFSTRQIPETQETVDTGDETETLNGSQTQSEVNRRRRKKRKEMSKTVVNPDENFYFYWLMTVTVCVLYNLWTLIVRQSFPELQKAASLFWYSGDGFTDAVFICDIMVQFRTGYLEQGLMVYNSKKLATHYLKSRAFVLDVLSLLPLDFLQLNIGVNPMLRFPRFLKIYRVYSYYYMVESRTVYPNLWRVVNLIHILLILAHWFGCFYYLLSEAEGFRGDWVYPYRPGDYATLTRKYLGSLYWSTLTLTTIGDLPTPETNAESRGRSKAMTTSGQSEGVPRRGHKSRLLQFNSNYGLFEKYERLSSLCYWLMRTAKYLFTIISYLIGVFIFATIVGQVGNVITNRNANRLEFERLLDGAKTYMRHHKVPGGMKRRVLRWYDYSWSRGRIQGGGDINTALGLLPDKLKTELALHVNLSVLKKVTIFQECQPEFLHDLVLKMKAYIFTPGDLICRKGEVAREMFIIADGILDVISETGKVLTTMKAGDFFGEIGILNLDGLNKRTADVRSVGYSELFSLSREDVLSAMKDYPEAQEILQSLGRKRLMEAKNASKMHKAQVKQIKDHDSSGDSDTAGKRIVEKLRSDVKGLKSALGRSRRGTKSKETFEKIEEYSRRKISAKKHSILRRMSHVQSSEENEADNDADPSPIGAGLPLLQRLKLLKEKQEKEKNKQIVFSGIQTIKDDETGAESTETDLPFRQKLKCMRQKEAKRSLVRGSSMISSTVRTQVSGVRFEKSASKIKTNSCLTDAEEKIGEIIKDKEICTLHLKRKDSTETDKMSIKEKLQLIQPNQEKEKTLIPKILQEAITSPTSKFETAVNVSLVEEHEKLLPKTLSNKSEVPKSKEAWKLLKKSSISCSKPEKIKFKGGGKKFVIRVSKKGSYLSKSDTVLEKQKTEERYEEKRSRSISPSENSKSQKRTLKLTVENLMKERKRSKSVGHSPKIEEEKDESIYWEFPNSWASSEDAPGPRNVDERNADVNLQKMKMKKYNSIGDLSPEYSGLPFVKRLKILNERQKLEELEKELLVRSVSLDVPDSPISNHGSILIRSQSEASTIEFKNICDADFRTEQTNRKKEKARTSLASYDESVGSISERHLDFRKLIDDGKKLRGSEILTEDTIVSPESNETIERRHLKSILKKLSADDYMSDEDQSFRNFTRSSILNQDDHTEMKKLMRAPTIEGYAARHKKLTKSVTFDSDTLPSSPDPVSEQPVDETNEKGFCPMSPTAILTLHLSNLSMIPIASPVKKNKSEELSTEEEKLTNEKRLDAETTRIGKTTDIENFKSLVEEKKNILPPYVLQELIEKNLSVLNFLKSLDDEFAIEIKRKILQLLQQILEEVQGGIQYQFNSLQTELQNRGHIILQLQSKIRDLEIKILKNEEKKFRTQFSDQNQESNQIDPDRIGVPFQLFSASGESFGVFASPRVSPAGAENSSKTRENDFVTLTQTNLQDFHLDCCPNVINPEAENQMEAHAENSHSTGDTSRLGITKSQNWPSDEEKKLVESSQLFRSNNFRRKKHKLKRNFSMEETSFDRTPVGMRLDDNTRRPIEGQSKESFIKQGTELQRPFSSSQRKTSDFVSLNIDDSSASSEVEDFNNADWEVQMLIKELAKKDPSWETEEEEDWMSEIKVDVEPLSDIKKLEKEVNTLKQMVSGSDLTCLTNSELDILESIIEARDQKLSLLTKSKSLDDSEKNNRQKIQRHICPSSSDYTLKNEEPKKKLWLRHKIGQALSFDFHDIEYRKPKSVDYTRHKAFCPKKQKTISGSRKQHQNLNNLWRTSSRLRDRVFEDSNRTIKSMAIGRSTAASSRSSLPILIPNILPHERTCDMRMSLPILSAKELRANFPERLKSSFSLSEEGHQEKDFKNRDSVFMDLELSGESSQKQIHDLNLPSTSGEVGSKDFNSNSSINSFIRSVGQRMRQVMVRETTTNRNQVPTISKLCDSQPMLKETELIVSKKSKGNGTPPEEDDKIPEKKFSRFFDAEPNDPKANPPDL